MHRHSGLLGSIICAAMLAACGGGGGGAADSPAGGAGAPVVVPAPNAAPTAAKLVEVSSMVPGQLTASWLPASDDTTPVSNIKYQLHASTDAAFTPSAATLKFEGIGVNSAAVTSGWTNGARYTLKLLAIDQQGAVGTSDAIQVAISDTAVALQPQATVQQLGSAQVAQISTDSITLQPGTKAPAVGQFLVSADGSGYLRKVLSTSTAAGGAITVKTSPAALNTVVNQVSVASAFKLASVPTEVAAASTSRATISAVVGPSSVDWKWPQTGFQLSKALPPPARVTAQSVRSEQGVKTIAATTTGGATIDVSAKTADGGQGRYVKVLAPDTVGILTGTSGTFTVESQVTSKYTSVWSPDEIPLAICRLEIIDNPLPAAVQVTGTAGATFKPVDTTGGTYQAAQTAASTLALNTASVAPRAEPYTIKARLYLDKAKNRCLDFNGRTGLLGGGWAETVDADIKLVVVSTPDFPKSEVVPLKFTGDFSVDNTVTFTFDPTLEAEVILDGARIKKARLDVKARPEVRQELTVTAGAAGFIDQTVPLIGARKFVKVFTAGPLPIVMSGTFTVDMRVQGNVTGRLNTSQTLTNSIEDMLYGMTYQDGKWDTHRGARPSHSLRVTGDGDATANLKISLLPTMAVSFYESLTGRLVVEPYVTAAGGVHGKISASDVDGTITAEGDYWLTKAEVTAGMNAYLMADLSVFDAIALTWPSTAKVNNYKTYSPLELVAETKVLGLPKLDVVFDPLAKHPTDSRAFLFRGSVVDVPNPFKARLGVGPDSYLPFSAWTQKPKVLVTGDSGYVFVEPPAGSAPGDFWIRFAKPGAYTVRLGGFSKMGGWARQIAEVTVQMTDLNSNAIIDQWETKYGLNVGTQSGSDIASADPDKDGRNNLNEWKAGTDPKEADNALTITEVLDTAPPRLGTLGQGDRTDDSRPRLSGTLREALTPGSTVRIYANTDLLLGAAAVTGKTWVYTPVADLIAGAVVFTAVIADAKGVQGESSGGWALIVGRDAGLPPTGVTNQQCYQAGSDGVLACNSAGAIALSGPGKQDGMRAQPFDYRLVPKSGAGNYDRTECVFDAITGLTWEGKTNDGGVRDHGRLYSNYGDGRTGDASAYVIQVNRMELCGYGDWRLPTAFELLGLVHFGLPTPGPFIDVNWFPYVEIDAGLGHLSSSSLAGGANIAWVVSFSSGLSYANGFPHYPFPVRLVR